jgi:hypothetical protein
MKEPNDSKITVQNEKQDIFIVSKQGLLASPAVQYSCTTTK